MLWREVGRGEAERLLRAWCGLRRTCKEDKRVVAPRPWVVRVCLCYCSMTIFCEVSLRYAKSGLESEG